MTPSAAVQFVLDLFPSFRSPPSPPIPTDRPPAPAPAPRPSRAAPAARDEAQALFGRLRALGLARIERCRLTNNRRTMVSFRGAELRVHRGYLAAPDAVLRAIVTLVQGRTRAQRAAARTTILAFPVVVTPRTPRREPRHPDDEPTVRRLVQAHAEFNVSRFGGRLSQVAIRVSRRMKTRLGHFSPGTHGDGPEIAISRRHLRRHGWADAIETLLHEMVHQWQYETGLPLDHGSAFRKKAREIGITPRAKRPAP